MKTTNNKQNDEKFLDRVRKAKVQLLLDHCFFGTLAMKLESRICHYLPSIAGTDGKVIWWNPLYANEWKLDDHQIAGVLAHEIMHVALGFFWRRGDREMQRFNMAHDYSFNDILIEAGLKLPKDGLFCKPDHPEYLGKSAEAIYSLIPPLKEIKLTLCGGAGENAGDGPKGRFTDPGKCGGVLDCPPEELKELENEWKAAVASAANVAKQQGKLPAGMERYVEEIINPSVPWQTVLAMFVQRTARNDYSWTHPNRRHLQRGIILPTLISDELPDIVLAVDTSGSIGKRELDAFAAEISSILSAFDTTIHVLYADAEVAGYEEFKRADLPLKLNPKGGGGTNFEVCFDEVAKMGIEPAAFIYLTDLAGPLDFQEPEYPVMWVSTTDDVAPWGETIKLIIEE